MGKRILLADDSITIQKVIELTFSDEDFDVVTVGNGRLAIERAQEIRPDIVLCDIIMPEKDGYEVCDFVKRNPALAHVPVLLLTGAFEPFDQDRAARVGCDGYLAKPFEPQTLIAKVKELLARAASRPAAAATVAAPPPAPPAMPVRPTPPAQPPVPQASPPVVPAVFEIFAPPVPVFEASQPETRPRPEDEPGVTLIPEEAFVEEAGGTFVDAVEFAEQEPAEPAPAPDQDLFVSGDAIEAMSEELLTFSPEAPPAAGVAPVEDPVQEEEVEAFPTAAEPEPWGMATAEVPLEDRAQASVDSAQSVPFFEEVFEEEPTPEPEPSPGPPVVAAPAAPQPPERQPPPVAPSAPFSLAAASAPVPVVAPPPPAAPTTVVVAEPSAPAEEPAGDAISFADLTLPPTTPPVGQPSTAAQLAVPAEMVQQIAQRVVAQISEKVVREVAWEIIPDLAEALIKKEIERLKAELQQT
jgi:CheY-like chemotaxis protein